MSDKVEVSEGNDFPGKNRTTFEIKLDRDYWISYDEVRLHQRFQNLLMQGYSSEEAKKIIDEEAG